VLLFHGIVDTLHADGLWEVHVDVLRRAVEAQLAAGRRPIPPGEYADRLRLAEQNSLVEQNGSVEQNSQVEQNSLVEQNSSVEQIGSAAPGFVVTFDDGFAGTLDLAAPLLAELGVPAACFATVEFLGRPRMLSNQGLRALAASGMVIGSHTMTHPHLDCVLRSRLRQELGHSRDRLEEILERPVDLLAYPHGSNDRNTRRTALDVGYRAAFAVRNRLSHDQDDVWRIARLTVTRETTPDQLTRWAEVRATAVARSNDTLATITFRQWRRIREAVRGLG
jgi:peptidoglycan/xylan/chitin deacetylase (PgdA/CDA1 family)